MQIKTTPSITVLYFSTTTTLKDVGQYALVVAKKLYAEAARQNILPVGPVYWLYYDCNGNMSDPFTLEIALPLESAPTQESEFPFKELPPFKAVSYFFDGPWEKIFEAYDRIITWTKSNGYSLTDNFREAYIYITNDYKLTEINVGIE
jgi:effector-binding domain-containing protein